MAKFPWLTLSTAILCLTTFFVGDLFELLAYQRPASDQSWRFLTASFVHYDAVHLLTNMLALVCLGMLFERDRGAGWLAILIILNALVTTLFVHFFVLDCTTFVGISCVNYALTAYFLFQQLNKHQYCGGIFFCLLGFYQILNALEPVTDSVTAVPLWQAHLWSHV